MDEWTDEELAASVAAYRQMQQMDTSGQKYTKVQVYRDLADRFGRTVKSYEFRMQNISAVLDELGEQWIPGLKPATNVGAVVKPRLMRMLQQGSGKRDVAQPRFKHGDKRTWELAVDAVTALGGSARPADIQAWIQAAHADYNTKNLTADLMMLAVNSPSRTSYSQNARPRRTDQGSEFDRLFRVGDGPGVRYEHYDPAEHGVWEIFADPASGNRHGMSVRQVVSPITAGVEQAGTEAEQQGAFNAEGVEDARQRTWSAIVRRRGQASFRKALLDAYESTCAMSGCTLPDVLEAAHVHPYRGTDTNVVSNGLLLRADIHTLFDLGLIAVDSASLTILVAPQLAGTDYGRLHGVTLRQPSQPGKQVSASALDWHRSRCAW